MERQQSACETFDRLQEASKTAEAAYVAKVSSALRISIDAGELHRVELNIYFHPHKPPTRADIHAVLGWDTEGICSLGRILEAPGYAVCLHAYPLALMKRLAQVHWVGEIRECVVTTADA